MRFLSLLPIFLVFFRHVAAAYETTWCNINKPCPEELPCCNGEVCGYGNFFCLVGCNHRFSFNLTSCLPSPRMSSFKDDMSDPDAVRFTNYFGDASQNRWLGLERSSFEKYQNVTLLTQRSAVGSLTSTSYLWFGKVGATIKSARGRGVDTYFSLISDASDTIVFNFDGRDLNNVQTGVWTFDDFLDSRMFAVDDTFDEWHYYEFDWSEDKLVWSVDGQVAQTLLREDTWNERADRYDFPSNPARVEFQLIPSFPSTDPKKDYNTTYEETEDYKAYGYNYAFVTNVSVEAYGLPSFVSPEDESKYTAFTYNSTSGARTQVILTDEPTVVGNNGTGFDPNLSGISSNTRTTSYAPFTMTTLSTKSYDEHYNSTTSYVDAEAPPSSSKAGAGGMFELRRLWSWADLLLVGALML